jgi:hypothetical protein
MDADHPTMMKVSHIEGRVRFIIMLDGISAALRYHGGQELV